MCIRDSSHTAQLGTEVSLSRIVTSREDLLRQELRQAQHHTELQEQKAQANAYEAARYYQNLVNLNQNASTYHEKIRRFALEFQQRVVAEAESRHSHAISDLQQNAAGLQQNQATPEHMVQQRRAVLGKANTSLRC
eukprot:3385036-Amphidinium_carterae.2